MENKKIQQSKATLKAALLTLLQKKRLETISVSEICETAQINRTTFYKYFSSPDNLLFAMEEDCFQALNAYFSNTEQSELEIMEGFLRYIKTNREQFQVLCNRNVDQEFPEKLFQMPVIQEIMNIHMPPVFSKSQARYMRTFFYQGGYGIIREWLNAGCLEAPEEIAGILTGLGKFFQSEKEQ